MVGSFIIGLKQLKIISRVTKAKHLFDAALSNKKLKIGDAPYWLHPIIKD